MQIKDFSGGLNTRLDPSLIRNNEARIYKNIDNNSAVLKPVLNKTLAVEVIEQYSYYSEIDARWFSYAAPTDFLIYKNTLYAANRTDKPVRLIDGIEKTVGIEAPASAPTVTVTNAPRPIERVTITADFDGGADLEAGVYKYKIVNKSATTNLTSLTDFEEPVEETTAKPARTTGRHVVLSNQSRTGSRYRNFLKQSVAAGENRLTLSFDDTNADQIRVYRFFDNAWRDVSGAFYPAATNIVDDTYDISNQEELVEDTKITGTIQYAITFYDSSTGIESKPILTEEVEVINGTIQITSIPSSTNSRVDTVRIYRIGGNITAFSLVDTINNGVTSYTDTIKDTDIIGTILAGDDFDLPKSGFKYLKEAYAMLFAACEDKLYFTPIGQPEAWPENYFLDFSDDITGISKTSIGLLVHTQYKTFLVTGTGPTSFTQQILANDQGCISHDTIQETKDTAIWLSNDGICASDGSDVKVLSRDKLGKLTLNPINAVLYDQVYYLQLANTDIIALDFDRGIFKKFNYETNYLVVAKDKLYGHKEGSLYELNTGEFNSQHYRSPDFTAGSMNKPKIYTAINFYSIGEIKLNVYIDDELVGTYNKNTTDSHEVKIPQDKRKGFYISFEIIGTGTLRELAWEEGSANG